MNSKDGNTRDRTVETEQWRQNSRDRTLETEVRQNTQRQNSRDRTVETEH